MSSQRRKKEENQGNLFLQPKPPKKPEREHGLARNTDPDTSKVAAREFDPAEKERIFLDAVKNSTYGLTSKQVVDITGEQQNSMNPRSRPLCKKKLLYESGLFHRGKSGKQAIVWRATGKSYPSDDDSIHYGGLERKAPSKKKPVPVSSVPPAVAGQGEQVPH